MTWERVKLGSFLRVRDLRFKPGDKRIAGLKRVDKIDFSGKLHLSEAPTKTDMILVKKGDLLISGINVYKGAVVVYEGEEEIVATIHYSSYEFDSGKIDIEFLKLFLKSPEFLEAIKEQVPGGIKTEIKPKQFLPLEILIPNTVDKQRKVVSSFSKVAMRNVELAKELIHQLLLVKQLRQAFLREAMQGKLLPQDPKDEPASELLKRIKAEKEKLIGEGKLKKEKPLPPIKPEEIPYEIPKGWVWCRLGEVAYIASGSTPKKDAFIKEGVPYLKMYNIKNQRIAFDQKPQFIRREVHEGQLRRSRAFKGDLIMNIVGPPLGKLAIIPDSLPECNFNQAGVVIRSIDSKVNMWLFWYLNEQSEINSIATKGIAGQDNISVTQTKNMRIPLPPPVEAAHINSKLDLLMNFCEGLDKNIEQSRLQNEELLRQVLREVLTTGKIDKPRKS